jgi:hypothetical protein
MWRKISLYAIPFGIAVVAACGGSSNNGEDGGGGGSGSSSGSSGGGASGDAGVACGLQSCGASQVCCFNSMQAGTCVAAGSCMASSLTCTSKGSCSGQSCCFSYVGDSGTDFRTACQDSCDSTSYELCATSADCSNGGMCFMGPYARYCVSFEGGFTFPEGGFTFPRRDASMGPPGDDASTTPPGDDASEDAASSE